MNCPAPSCLISIEIIFQINIFKFLFFFAKGDLIYKEKKQLMWLEYLLDYWNYFVPIEADSQVEPADKHSHLGGKRPRPNSPKPN